MQFPLSDITMPNSINYGGIGSFIGNEVTNSYDHIGKYLYSNCGGHTSVNAKMNLAKFGV